MPKSMLTQFIIIIITIIMMAMIVAKAPVTDGDLERFEHRAGTNLMHGHAACLLQGNCCWCNVLKQDQWKAEWGGVEHDW